MKIKIPKVIHTNYAEFFKAITEYMPEFDLDTGIDPHKNTEFERNLRLLNQWKVIKINEFSKKYSKGKKILPIPATALFLLKLELQEYKYHLNNLGKKTHEEAIAFIKSHE